jgi:nucleoside-diphosphate-sugar epimerase
MSNDTSITSYAILGSTGNTGSALIRNFLEIPDVRVRAYCRNRSKLYRLVPEIIDNKRFEVFEGSIDDVSLIGDCIGNCKAVFMAVTTNDNIPGCRVSEDVARSVITALERMKRTGKPGYVMPKLVLLSSATIDREFRWVFWFVTDDWRPLESPAFVSQLYISLFPRNIYLPSYTVLRRTVAQFFSRSSPPSAFHGATSVYYYVYCPRLRCTKTRL